MYLFPDVYSCTTRLILPIPMNGKLNKQSDKLYVINIVILSKITK